MGRRKSAGRVLRFPEKRRTGATPPPRRPAGGLSMRYTIDVEQITDALMRVLEAHERDTRR